jgi:hypothetical protein
MSVVVAVRRTVRERASSHLPSSFVPFVPVREGEPGQILGICGPGGEPAARQGT